MNAWREELRAMLDRLETARQPALRRSRREDGLYATDLPQAGGKAAMDDFCRRAEKAGWQWEETGGWIELRRCAEAPPSGWFDGPFGPEAGCCASLQERHRAGRTDAGKRIPDEEQSRWTAALIKAGEEGPAAYELACFRIHREWAEHLRKREPISGMNPRFFGSAEKG